MRELENCRHLKIDGLEFFRRAVDPIVRPRRRVAGHRAEIIQRVISVLGDPIELEIVGRHGVVRVDDIGELMRVSVLDDQPSLLLHVAQRVDDCRAVAQPDRLRKTT